MMSVSLQTPKLMNLTISLVSKRPCLISVTCLFSDANKLVENRLKNIDLLQNGAISYFNEND